MYLEISPRQSGKTERMVRTAYDITKNQSKKCTIFVHNHSMVDNIRMRLEALHRYYYPGNNYCSPDRHTFMGCEILAANIHSTHSKSFDDSELFFDEFDFFEDDEFFTIMSSRSNLYSSRFYTTPRFIRTLEMLNSKNPISGDVLLHLLIRNKLQYTAYPSLSRNVTPEFISTFNKDVLLTEFFGIFIR